MTANGRIIGTLSKEVVILHIIGEDHYLSDIEIAPELIVLEAFLQQLSKKQKQDYGQTI